MLSPLFVWLWQRGLHLLLLAFQLLRLAFFQLLLLPVWLLSLSRSPADF
jgi:hypothetical protein